MPKLDNTHLSTRIMREIERLKNGEELVVRNVKALLSDEQLAAVSEAWAEQKLRHRGKRPQSEEQRKELGMKNKREVYIEALETALAEANASAADFMHEAQIAATKRQIETYTDAIEEAKKLGKGIETARNQANNDLTRAGLSRLDRARRGYDKRDREVNELENQINARLRGEMNEDELEQEELLEQYQKRKDS